MADEYRMALTLLLRKAELETDADFLRESVRVLAQQLMELEVRQHVGAECYDASAASTEGALWSRSFRTITPG